jgi:hypothetical protein
MVEIDVAVANTIKDLLVDQLPPEVRKFMKYYDKNIRLEQQIQHTSLQNIQLAQTREALKKTIDDASSRIAEANKKIDELQADAKASKKLMWVGLVIGAFGLIVGIASIVIPWIKAH